MKIRPNHIKKKERAWRRAEPVAGLVLSNRRNAERYERTPGPGSSDNHRDEEPRAPAVFGVSQITIKVLVDEEEIEKARIAAGDQPEPRNHDCQVDQASRRSHGTLRASRARRSNSSHPSAIPPDRTSATGPFG